MTETFRKGNSNPPIELGILDGGMNLLLDGIESPIPDYMVCRQLTLGKTDDVLTKTQYEGKPNDGTHSHGPSGRHSGHSDYGVHSHEDEAPHIHDVLIPEKMRKLKPGDRVLVAWASGTPVIVDIVFDKGELNG
ncbi:MAG: hypothetical protein IIV02_01095 [Peptococcaceae bacterium]|nr:hypothetical protein [Peptococcaceae bacterium]